MEIKTVKSIKLNRDEIQKVIADYCKQKGYDIKAEEITFVVGPNNDKYPRYELQFCSVDYENHEEVQQIC